jgi:DNA-binding XRE family transcriptional regulator
VIRNEHEYQLALRRLAEDDQFAEAQRQAFIGAGLPPEEVERALEPTQAFHAQLGEEIEWYERVQKRDFDALRNLAGLGRLLIALRIANGLTQRELADRLDVSEAQISRDERNEYHGITIERAQRVLEALNETVNSVVEHRPAEATA